MYQFEFSRTDERDFIVDPQFADALTEMAREMYFWQLVDRFLWPAVVVFCAILIAWAIRSNRNH